VVATLRRFGDQACFQHGFQVLRNRRLGYGQVSGQYLHRLWLLQQQVEDGAPGGVRQGAQ